MPSAKSALLLYQHILNNTQAPGPRNALMRSFEELVHGTIHAFQHEHSGSIASLSLSITGDVHLFLLCLRLLDGLSPSSTPLGFIIERIVVEDSAADPSKTPGKCDVYWSFDRTNKALETSIMGLEYFAAGQEKVVLLSCSLDDVKTAFTTLRHAAQFFSHIRSTPPTLDIDVSVAGYTNWVKKKAPIEARPAQEHWCTFRHDVWRMIDIEDTDAAKVTGAGITVFNNHVMPMFVYVLAFENNLDIGAFTYV